MSDIDTLNVQAIKELGLKKKDFDTYLTVLKLGSAPLRKIAEHMKEKRSTVYDTLNRLKEEGLISFLDERRHRYFVAESPDRLRALLTQREVAVKEAKGRVESALPALEALMGSEGYRPSVHYFEGERGVKELLEMVLLETERTKSSMYRVYSSAGIRDLIAASWPGFNDKRKRMKIRVRAVSLGAGGTTHGLDDRRWLTNEDSAPMYTFIFAGRLAFVGLDKGDKLFGVVIEDRAISETQRLIFDSLWKTLS